MGNEKAVKLDDAVSNRVRVRARTARKKFAKLLASLERTHRGLVVAIEYGSGEHVPGRTNVQAAKKALRRFKGKPCHYFRIGSDALYHLYRLWPFLS